MSSAKSATVEQEGSSLVTKVKRFREGVVLKAKASKTITVQITRRIQHKKFKKVINRQIRYAVHDEKGLAKEGDKVRILQTRPISKTKKWTLIEVLSK